MLNWIKDNPIFFLLIFLAIAAPSLFVGAMRVIFYIVLGVVLLLVILGIIFRVKIARIQRDMQDQMGGQRGGQRTQSWGGFYTKGGQQQGEQKERVKIYQNQGAGEKKVSSDVGDYVEFEEVKEDK